MQSIAGFVSYMATSNHNETPTDGRKGQMGKQKGKPENALGKVDLNKHNIRTYGNNTKNHSVKLMS